MARGLAWIAVIGSLLAVIAVYESLPLEFPVSRWSVADKTWLIALRIPLINLLTLAALQSLSCSLLRLANDRAVQLAVAVLQITTGLKAIVESAEIPMLPLRNNATFLIVMMIVIIGLATGLKLLWPIIATDRWKLLYMTRAEQALAWIAVAGIVLLNVSVISG